MSSAISGLWTGCVSFKRFPMALLCPVCVVCSTLGGINHHANQPFNLTVLFLLKEVPMIPQPSYAQAGSVYYICLLRDDLLLHQGERLK